MGAMTCDDNRFEAIAKAREMLVSSTNIEDSPNEMAVLDTILFRFWQMGWIDALDVNARLKIENAKLREELEAVGTAAYLYGRYDLRAEMGKNRGRICPTCGCIVFDDEECCPDCNAEVDG